MVPSSTEISFSNIHSNTYPLLLFNKEKCAHVIRNSEKLKVCFMFKELERIRIN